MGWSRLLEPLRKPFLRTRVVTGIDPATSGIKIAQILHKGDQTTLLYLEILPPGDEGDLSLEGLASHLHRYHHGVTLPADRQVLFRPLRLPPMPDSDLPGAVQWEAVRHLPQGGEGMVMDYLPLRRSSEKGWGHQEVLLVAAEQRAVLEQARWLGNRGIQVDAVEANPIALHRVVRWLWPQWQEEPLMIADLGARYLEITILEGGQIRWNRVLSLGLDTGAAKGKTWLETCPQGIAPFMADPQGLPESLRSYLDRLVLELQRSQDFYRSQKRGERMARLVLTGGGALVPGLPRYLEPFLGMEIHLLDPFQAFSSLEGEGPWRTLRDQGPRLATAIGLALRPPP